VSSCRRWTASSGSVWLDLATCRILRSRAHYRPALDAAGNAVSGTDSGSIVWRVPAD
jgi:periplasmic protein TonB